MKKILMIAMAMLLSSVIKADTIKLLNGRVIHGKVASEEVAKRRKAPSGSTCVEFKNGGWIFIRTGQIVSVEVNDLDDFNKE